MFSLLPLDTSTIFKNTTTIYQKKAQVSSLAFARCLYSIDCMEGGCSRKRKGMKRAEATPLHPSPMVSLRARYPSRTSAPLIDRRSGPAQVLLGHQLKSRST